MVEIYNYTSSELEQLKQRVLRFIQQQPGYSGKSLAVLWKQEEGILYIQYGNDLQSGIAGFGVTTEAAFSDFLNEWNRVGGEDHIKRYAVAYKNLR